MKSLSQSQVIQLMRKRQGTRTAKDFAEELGISPQYLSDIYCGNREPGPAVLDALKLERNVIYKPATVQSEGLTR